MGLISLAASNPGFGDLTQATRKLNTVKEPFLCIQRGGVAERGKSTVNSQQSIVIIVPVPSVSGREVYALIQKRAIPKIGLTN
jgi:hypothetical protein